MTFPAPPGDEPIPLLAQLDRYVVLAKPSGVAVHRTRGSMGKPLLQRVRDQLRQRVYPVHRLDRGTSGVIVMALDPEAQAALARHFESERVVKTYLAVVRGWPVQCQTVDRALRRLDDDAVPMDGVDRQTASTTVEVLTRTACDVPCGPWPTSRYALVKAIPQEGRRHQIRRHLKHISHPIIGDTTYGKGDHNRLFRERFGAGRLLLHADRITFEDPFALLRREFRATWPADFREPVDACGLGVTEDLR